MKRLLSLILFAGLFCAAAPGYGQEMPQGNLIVVTRCSIADGNTVDDVLTAARAVDYQSIDNGPNIIFYRRPITGNNAPADRLMRAVYWSNVTHWATSSIGQESTPESDYLNSILSCDNSNRNFVMNYGVAGGSAYEGGDADETLVVTRSCAIKAGTPIQDVYAALVDLDQGQRQPGDNTLMQLSQRFLGPLDGIEMGTLATVRLVGENAEGLARRLDGLAKPQGTPADSVMAGCLDASLFTSHVGFWRQ